ncbi:MAG: alanine racemase [Eubacteriales bacterium]
MSTHPKLIVNLNHFKENIDAICSRCKELDISVAGVIKGFHAIPDMVKAFDESDCDFIASSRIEQLESASLIKCKKPLFLIRVPMISEIEEVVRYASYSLQSEKSVIEALEIECEKQNKTHKVVLMADLGDLREGFWNKDELIELAILIEKSFKFVKLAGIGTNLGCYGSIKATPAKMSELIEIAEKIEEKIERTLEIISGGGTTSTMMVFDKSMPKRINHLRIGEGIILACDYEKLFETDAGFLHKDVFTLEGEIIELKDKPSFPVGELSYDAFGNIQTYEDRGIRKRALVALGRVDVGDVDALMPKTEGVEILGASSDHLILDVEAIKNNLKIGDKLSFGLSYCNMVYATSSQNVKIEVQI